METFDTILIGQGIAGTTLAWQLHWMGERLLIIDDPQPLTASRIAAGLITPITGQRLALSWNFELFWQEAVEFYRHAERNTGTTFFTEVPTVRFLTTALECEKHQQRRTESAYQLHFGTEPKIDGDHYQKSLDAFTMQPAAKLNVPAFLSSSRAYFTRHAASINESFNPNDLTLTGADVRLDSLQVKAKRMIFCEGIRAQQNPWFSNVVFDPAKGEILTVRIPGLKEPRVIHRGFWLAPLTDDLYAVGSTYDRENLETVPTPEGRNELLQRLRALLQPSIFSRIEMIDHRAAIRPIVKGRNPVCGFHPEYPQLGYFNGLASKGSLQAPWVARQFAELICGERRELPKSIDIHSRKGFSL